MFHVMHSWSTPLTGTQGETVASETKPKSRRLFWRTESGSVKERSSLNDTASRHSKDANVPQTPPLSAVTSATAASAVASSPGSVDDAKSTEEASHPPVAATARPRKKRESVDGRKTSDRLSLFGSSFSGTLGKAGKSRKPPPSLSGSAHFFSFRCKQTNLRAPLYSVILRRRTTRRRNTTAPSPGYERSVIQAALLPLMAPPRGQAAFLH